jgi:hypothetical protein
MSRVLLIDDLRDFRQLPAGVELTVARTSAEALEVLGAATHWDEIWLDHDLGENEAGVDSIMRVVDFLCEQAFNDQPVDVDRVRVHTSNPVGGQQMMLALQRYGYSVQRVNASDYLTVDA